MKFLKNTFDKNKYISREKTKEFSLPVINAKNRNNGIIHYGKKKDFETVEISIDIVNDGVMSTGNVYGNWSSFFNKSNYITMLIVELYHIFQRQSKSL